MEKHKESFVTTIKLEIQVEVHGIYKKPVQADFYANGGVGIPPEASEFEINKVLWDDIDITKNLDFHDFMELEQKGIENLENDY